MNYSLSGWLRESPEVSHAKKEVVGPFFHVHHYIDILHEMKCNRGRVVRVNNCVVKTL